MYSHKSLKYHLQKLVLYYNDEQILKFPKKSWKNTGDILVTDSQTKLSSFSSNILYNLSNYNSEKIDVDGQVGLAKDIALITFFCMRYMGVIQISQARPQTIIPYWRN